MPLLTYRPSGKLPNAVIKWALVSIIALMPVAYLYAWLMLFAPVGPLVVLFAIAFGGCCARAAHLTAKWGKARNPGRMARIGAGIGLIGWYWQWVAWLSIASDQSSVTALTGHATRTFNDFAIRPDIMYAIASQIRAAGLVDDHGRLLVKSPGFAWCLELLFFVSLPALFAYGKSIAPFCERGDSWGEQVNLPRKHAFITDEAQFVRELSSDPRATLDSLTAFPATEEGFSSLQLTLCRQSETGFVSVTNTAISKEGKFKREQSHTVISQVSVSIDLADDLIRQCATGGPLQQPPSADINPPELQLALNHLETGDYDAALAGAATYLGADDAHLRTDAIRLSALASSRKNRWNDALEFWRSLFDREATAHNALQVATASVMAGNIVHGEQWLHTAESLNATSRDVPPMQIQINFIAALKNSGNAPLALPHLQHVKAIYEDLHVTDPTFLFLRGVPQFSSFLENTREIITSALSRQDASLWYESMLPYIDSDGQTELSTWLDNGMPTIPQSPA